MRLTSVELAQELLSITSSEQIESWLNRVIGDDVLADGRYWRNVGDQRSNAGAIELSGDEINPLIERIVNGFEAMIELRVGESGESPENPRAAIESLFGVPQGESSRLDERQARELGENVVASFEGSERNSTPTVCVQDKGIGIHPSDFPDTVLALGQSEKGQKRYLIGMYGHGGSSTFDKCDYTIIVSRRHPRFLRSCQSDQLGWTIVRKQLRLRTNVYSYFVDPSTRSVPTFGESIGDGIGFLHGTRVSHIEYRDTGPFATQGITNRAFYTLNYRLFDPLLPWILEDNRENSHTSRTMRGVTYRISQLPAVIGVGSTVARQRHDATAIRHYIDYQHQLTSGSVLRVKWWILQDERVQDGRRRSDHRDRRRPYIDPTRRYAQRVVSVTRGGQTHESLTSNIFRRRGLRQLARSILVQVDTNDLTYEEGASFFASNRADLKTESQEMIERAINAAIGMYIDELRGIEREREQEILAGGTASDEDAIRRHLDPMIRAFELIRDGQGRATGVGRRRNGNFRGRQIPTYLRFARNHPLEVRPGRPTRIVILTDASDRVVRARRTQLRIEANPNDVGIRIDTPDGGSGRYRVNLYPSPYIPVGTQIELVASISQPGAWRKDADPLRILVIPPPLPYEGESPPTFMRFRSQNGSVRVRQGGARVSIITDARNDVIENGATFVVESPDQDTLPVSGWSGPKDGEFRVGLRIPDDAEVGLAGEIRASLTLNNGSRLDTYASLHIDPKREPGGQAQAQLQPNYEIKDVREIPIQDDEVSWQDMQSILDIDSPWNRDDVGAYFETGDEGTRKITFYLNQDNAEYREVVQRFAHRRSENEVNALREMHRTLLCFHLYRLATRNRSEESSDYDYREEMIRVSQTLLYTRREFIDEHDAEESD